MTALVPIALVGWVIVAIGLFTMLPPRRAVLTAYIMAWMFLPQGAIQFAGMPDLTKVTAASLGALLGVLLFDAGRLTSFRFSWVDLPMLAWCLSSMPSSMTNGLGIYDGLSGVLRDFMIWAVPYFVGRIYFNDLASLRELAIGVFIGGLVYVPLCLWEIRMSPQLHNIVYGYHPAHFAMSYRFGGYRPMVFMQHGLMVGMWMTSATLVGVWLWYTGALQKIRNAPMWMLVGVVGMTTVMCKSMGALALLALGLGLLFLNRYLKSNVVLAGILLIAPAYMLARVEGWWDGKELVDLSAMISEERAESLRGRLRDENLLIERASMKPIWGWGGWSRWRVKDERTGTDMTASDGWWVIIRGERGNVGLAISTIVVVLPFVLLLKRMRARDWSQPMAAGPAALAMLLMLWSIDNLLNAMHNPVYLVAAGGLAGFYVMYPRHVAQYHTAQQQALAALQAQQRAHVKRYQLMLRRKAARAAAEAIGEGPPKGDPDHALASDQR